MKILNEKPDISGDVGLRRPLPFPEDRKETFFKKRILNRCS